MTQNFVYCSINFAFSRVKDVTELCNICLSRVCNLEKPADACDMALTNNRRDENTDKSHRITEKIKIPLVITFIYAKHGGEPILIDKPIF
jgi:hypothetical protein